VDDPTDDPSGEWVALVRDGDLPLERAVRVDAGDLHVFLYRTEERIFALDDRCTHMGGPLHRGPVKAHVPQPTVTCPVHGSIFWLTDGRVVRGPAGRPQPVFEVRVNDGMVEVRPASHA
jgi:nitrite reductase/ring-hydroxylating ferredoxin subunit